MIFRDFLNVFAKKKARLQNGQNPIATLLFVWIRN